GLWHQARCAPQQQHPGCGAASDLLLWIKRHGTILQCGTTRHGGAPPHQPDKTVACVRPWLRRRIRKASGLSQAKFAKLIHVEVGTLRNWEQRRRTPTGSAQVLLRAIERDPRALLRAIA